MKFQMVFEGVDRASRIMNRLMAAEKKTSKAMSAGAAAAEKASKGAAAATAGHAGTLTKMQIAAQKAFAVAKAGADKAARSVQSLHRQTLALGKAGMGQIGKGSGKVMAGLSVAAAGAVSAVGLASLAAGKLVGVGSQFEKFQTILETTEGSGAKARDAMKWVSDFTTKTPYELEEVMSSFVKLRAYGLDPTKGLMTDLGNMSAAMGTPLMQSAEAIADAMTGENERLKEFGIIANKAGKEVMFNYVMDGQKKVAKALASDPAGIQAALQKIMSDRFGGAMDKLSGTWDGMISNMGDIWTSFQLAIMNAGLFDWMKDKLSGILETVNRMQASGQLDAWAKNISDRIVMVLDSAWSFASRVWQIMEKLGGYLQVAADYVGGWERLAAILAGMAFAPILVSTAAGIVQIAMGLSMLSAALLANPIALAIAAIVAGAVLIYTNWEPIKAFFLDLWTSISNAASAAWTAVKSAVVGAVQAIPGIVTGAWETVKTVLAWHPAIIIIQNWGAITAAVSDAVNSAFAAVQVVWDSVKALFDWSPVESIQRAWAGISDAVGGMIDGAAARAGAAWDKVKSVFTFGADEGTAEIDIPVLPDAATLRADADAALAKLAELDAAAAKIVPEVIGAVQQAQQVLASISFYDQGAALMETMAAGMRARAMVVVNEIQRMAQMVRDHLPSSPAKVGPLSDIHRLKFGETIASSIRAEPMVKAMRAAALATMGAASLNAPSMAAPMVAGTGADAARAQVASISAKQSRDAGSQSSGGNGGMPMINFSPKFEISATGNTADIQKQVELAMEKASRRLYDIWSEEQRRRNRTSM